MDKFVDRIDAGRQLGVRLSEREPDDTLVVAGLPRGGVVVAYEVARVLKVPLDVIIVRKVGVPSQPEFAMGALAEGGVEDVERDVVNSLYITDEEYSHAVELERAELERRVTRYRERCRALDFTGRTVVVVDDGIATGATARAGVASARARGAARIVFATPVSSASGARELSRVVDEFIALMTPHGSFSVGTYYERFEQTSDREVLGYLARAHRWSSDASSRTAPPRGEGEHSLLRHHRSP
ncbi:MAG: phosphoribosyltransferase family protein [Acidimicrobiales bacterium]